MSKSINEFIIILPFEIGSRHLYKFIVDGIWKHHEDAEYERNEYNIINNVVDLKKFQPLDTLNNTEENDDNLYSQEQPCFNDFLREPLFLPPIFNSISNIRVSNL